MTKDEIIKRLKTHANPKNVAGMARFGIQGGIMLGVNVPILRKMAREIGKDHKLAQELWDTRIHEARILATMIDDPKLVTKKQMDLWVADFDSWDICDQTCMNLFDKTPFAFEKAIEWSKRNNRARNASRQRVAGGEFIRRAGFALMASLAVHDKKATDKDFEKFFPIIKKYSTDDRNFVKKAVNWALRQIGKRNKDLCQKAIKTANEIKTQYKNNKTANWIANDAIRELKKRFTP